ncbi:MAG TPA: EAL domain-containing protein [Planctomycetota bacterium]|jgi:diguanylate cyclase (GGDEF)-like protein/PAS domain S-box-containing protein
MNAIHELTLRARTDVPAGESGLKTRITELLRANAFQGAELVARIESERQFRVTEERYALAARAGNEGLWDWNLRTGDIFFSPQWKSMLGFEEHEIGSDEDSWFQLVDPRDIDGLKTDIRHHLVGNKADIHCEYRVLNKHGETRWLLCCGQAVRDSDGRAIRLVGTQNDITNRKTVELKLIHDVFHDPLTGLPNRPLFMERLKCALNRLQRRQHDSIAVLFMDLDRFKVVNDSLGHSVGDQLLAAFAKRLQTCIRPCDTLARFGCDEFCVLMEDVNGLAGASALAERIHRELSRTVLVLQNEFFVTVSIGIALGSHDTPDSEHLLRNADIAMYRAKSMGRGRQEFYQSGMHTQAIKLQSLESGLHRAVRSLGPDSAEKCRLDRALAAKEFVLHYQPIVSLQSGELSGFEALIRWDHPASGRINPDDFIPLAEETGLIIPITFWVLREACRQMEDWRRRYPGMASASVNVNVSSRTFSQVSLVPEIATILKETGLPGSGLKIEVTESVLMENSEATGAVLSQLKNLGVKLCLDDFGTGYSSLSYLHRFPLDVVKIDRSFISGLKPQESRTGGIVKAIMALAHNLNMRVVAEGVETEQQLAELLALRCDCAQGYLFSKPAEPVAVEKLMGMRWRSCTVGAATSII